MNVIVNELKKYGIVDAEIKCISDKDGVLVYKVFSNEVHYILKYFDQEEYKREIKYYELLKNSELKTVTTFGCTKDSILMEDIHFSTEYRLATKDDLNNEKVILSLAKFYRNLHNEGKKYFKEHKEATFYSELKSIDMTSIEYLKLNSEYKNEAFWEKLILFIEKVRPYYEEHKTLTYNDFFYGNMIVSKDLSEAYMFDYNLLGEGLAYFDLRNVMSGLEGPAKNYFVEGYGKVNPIEKYIDCVTGPIFTLIEGYKRDKFPSWAIASKELLLSGEILDNLNVALSFFSVKQ